MSDGNFIVNHTWHPFEYLGLTHPFFSINSDTVTYTWVVMGIIFVLSVVGRLLFEFAPQSVGGYLTKRYVNSFISMVRGSFNTFHYNYFAFIAVLFTFLLISNCIIVIPFTEEPTKDLNTTIALSLLAFFYIQINAARSHGLIAYLNDFFKTPLQVFGRGKPYSLWFFIESALRIIANICIGLLLFPIELLGKVSSVISLSFRLFGNIFAGAVIASLWANFKAHSLLWQLFGLLSGINLVILLFFGIFEGVIQAFVFTILSLTYLSRAVQHQQ